MNYLLSIKLLLGTVSKENGWTTASKATLIAAIIAAVVSIINIIVQSYQNKKKIDADLKASARIDWIKNVRKETSELLSLSGRRQDYIYISEELYKIGTYSDVEIEELNANIFDVSNSITTQLYKLKLMFGPENGEIKEDEYALIMRNQWEQLELFTIGTKSYQNESEMKQLIDKLRDKETNKGKNEIIVGLINLIILSVKYDPKLFEEEVKKANKEKRTVNSRIYQTYLLTKTLGNIMRLYIKIEWDLAKKGK